MGGKVLKPKSGKSTTVIWTGFGMKTSLAQNVQLLYIDPPAAHRITLKQPSDHRITIKQQPVT